MSGSIGGRWGDHTELNQRQRWAIKRKPCARRQQRKTKPAAYLTPGREEGQTLAVLAEAIVRERRVFAETLRAVGPDAPTLVPTWTAHDVAAHVVSLDRLRGVPTFVGRTIVSRGVRLNDVAGRFADRGMRSSKRRGFDWAVDHLEHLPPALLLRESVAPVGLFEVFVHHEDVRRAISVQQPRVTPEELADVMQWLLRYHRRLLQNVRLLVRTPAGEHAEGTGPEVTVSGPVGEVVLWLAGRRDASDAEAAGEMASAVQALRI